MSNATDEVGSFEVSVLNPGATVRKQILWIGSHALPDLTQAGGATQGGGAYIINTNAITGVRFLMSSGNLTSGTLDVYRRQRS